MESPRFSRSYAQGEIARLQHLVTARTRVVLVFNLAAIAVTVMLGKILSWPVFGPALASAYVLLVILLGVQLVNPAAGWR